MKTTSSISDNFLGMIKNLSTDVKLDLIAYLTHSLKEAQQETKNSDSSLQSLFGAWESKENAEEIIKDIQTNRYTNREIEEL